MKKRNIIFIVTIGILIVLVGTLIQSSARLQQYSQAQRLCEAIQQGQEIDTTFSNGTTLPTWLLPISKITQTDLVKIPLVEACYYRNIQAVKVLLENGADPNYFFDGHWSPIEAAIWNGPVTEESFDIVQMLLQYGADPTLHAADSSALDYLSVFIWAGNDNVWVSRTSLLLVDYGAPVEISPDRHLLICAAHGNNIDLVEKLLTDYHCDIDVTAYQNRTALIAILVPPFVSPIWSDETVDMVGYLLAHGADPYVKDASGKSAYVYAKENNLVDVVVLIENSQKSQTN